MADEQKARSHKPVPGNENGEADRLTPKQVAVPALPTYSDEPGERLLHDEQQVARVEILMTKGVRDRQRLMLLLGVDDKRKMDRYMQRVYARWEVAGATQAFARHRGEGLARLDLIEAEIWNTMITAEATKDQPGYRPDARVVLVATKNLIDLQNQRMQLLGLTPKVIERLGMTDAAKQMQFAASIGQHDKLSRVAKRMLELMTEAANAPRQIEGEATDVTDGSAHAPA